MKTRETNVGALALELQDQGALPVLQSKPPLEHKLFFSQTDSVLLSVAPTPAPFLELAGRPGPRSVVIVSGQLPPLRHWKAPTHTTRLKFHNHKECTVTRNIVGGSRFSSAPVPDQYTSACIIISSLKQTPKSRRQTIGRNRPCDVGPRVGIRFNQWLRVHCPRLCPGKAIQSGVFIYLLSFIVLYCCWFVVVSCCCCDTSTIHISNQKLHMHISCIRDALGISPWCNCDTRHRTGNSRDTPVTPRYPRHTVIPP